ncbi:GtrA family protein [Loktanella sp. Alg231-35]|uniref:GtrA family protein n=1 Tax=Loktanella sp. Alg231-35 TaxID=1922220 RepID=UPI000D562428|nr:GtrA family protein [Loktanella sp. Alg231-35]
MTPQNRPSWQSLVRFMCVGVVGFIVDGGLLFSLIALGTDPYTARLCSFPLAVLATWWLNRVWTFQSSNRSKPVSQLGRYVAVQLVGVTTNYLAYATVLNLTQPTPEFVLLGFVIGSTIGLFVNFLGARFFAFPNAGAT